MPAGNRTRRALGRGCGFTLFEVMVVVLILGISGAVVVPLMGNTDKFQAMSAAKMIHCDLEYARDEAITSQTPVTVTFDPAAETYSLSNASGALIHPMTKTEYTVNFSTQDGFSSLDVTSASFGGSAEVTFDETGAASVDGTVEVQAGPHPYEVKVYRATGRVKATYTGTD